MKKRFFSRSFTNDILPTIKFLQEHAKFNKFNFSSLMSQKPKAFLMLDNNADRYKINQKVSIKELHEYFLKEYSFIPTSFKCLFLKNPQIFNYTMEEINQIISFCKTSFELSPVD